MAYIEVHQSLRDHRKILALASELDMPEPHVAGHCLFLWLWSLDNAQEGVLPTSARVIERVAGWLGEQGALVTAMVNVGMLDRDEETGQLAIHDWWDYAGRLIEKRREDAERKRIARTAAAQKNAAPPPATPAAPAANTPSPARPQDVQRMSAGRRLDGARTVPYRTLPNTTLPDPDSELDQPGVCVYSANEQAAMVAKPDAEQPPPAADTHTPDKKTEKTPKLPDVLWQVWLSPDGIGCAPIDRGQEREWRDGLATLARASPNGVLTPDELTLRVRRYRERFNRDGVPFTLSMRALRNNWGKLGEEQNRGPTTGTTGTNTNQATRRKPVESDQERYERARAEMEAGYEAIVARQQSRLAASGSAHPMPGMPGARAGPGEAVARPTAR